MDNLETIIKSVNIKLNNGVKLKECDELNLYNGIDWKKYIKFSTKRYCKNLVFRNKLMDVFIICWKKGQKSGIHDHPESGCLLKVVEGELLETVFTDSLSKIKENKLITGSIGYQEGNNKLHSINSNKCDSISIHIYSPAKHCTKFYTN